MNRKNTPTEKFNNKRLFAQFIELKVNQGYDITPYLFKPYNFWDFKKIKIEVNLFNDI